MLTLGMFCAIHWSSLTSSIVASTIAVSDHHDAQRALHRQRATGAPQAVEHAPAAERERQQHQAGAERVGEPDRDGAAARRADGDHGGEDRPGAGRVDEAQRGADEQARGEAVAARARAQPRERRERALEALAELRDDQREPEQRQHDDRDVAQRVGAQPDAADDLRDADDRDRERRRQPDDDAERAPPPARSARREHRREHRQHARRHGRAGADHQREEQQEQHPSARGLSPDPPRAPSRGERAHRSVAHAVARGGVPPRSARRGRCAPSRSAAAPAGHAGRHAGGERRQLRCAATPA